MTAVTHTELAAKVEAIETKTDAKVEGIRNLIDRFSVRAEERDKAMDLRWEDWNLRWAERDKALDLRFTHIDGRIDDLAHEMKDVQKSVRSQRYWIVGTAVGAVLGIGAFNATVLSSMVAAFESGKNISTAQAQIMEQSKQVEQLLRKMNSRLDMKADAS